MKKIYFELNKCQLLIKSFILKVVNFCGNNLNWKINKTNINLLDKHFFDLNSDFCILFLNCTNISLDYNFESKKLNGVIGNHPKVQDLRCLNLWLNRRIYGATKLDRNCLIARYCGVFDTTQECNEVVGRDKMTILCYIYI